MSKSSREAELAKEKEKHAAKLEAIHEEWDLREALPDIRPAAYEFIHVTPESNFASVSVGLGSYTSLREEGEEHPTLDTVRLLAASFTVVPRMLTRACGASLWPWEIKSKCSKQDEDPVEICPFIIEIKPPGKAGLRGGLLSIEWFAMVGAQLTKFSVQWPYHLGAESGQYMKPLGKLHLRLKRYGNSDVVSSVERNEFEPNKPNIYSIESAGGEAILQDVINYSSGSRSEPGNKVLYWIDICQGPETGVLDLCNKLEK